MILYQAEDGRTRIQCRFEDETLWLTQALIAELFQKDVRTINEHLANIYDEGELARESTIRKFRIVRLEGSREVAREIDYYSLPAILAVGYRVRSPRGTQFRQWATARLSEYLVKGFTMDDERLKNPPGLGVADYFTEEMRNARIAAYRERGNSLRRIEVGLLPADMAEGTRGRWQGQEDQPGGVPLVWALASLPQDVQVDGDLLWRHTA
jgi:hypothetical protein